MHSRPQSLQSIWSAEGLSTRHLKRPGSPGDEDELHEAFLNQSARGLKFPARFHKPAGNFKRRFEKICSGSRVEITAWVNWAKISSRAEIRHVIGHLD